MLKLAQGHTVDEVAECMGRKRQAVRYLLQTGRARIRELIQVDERARELFREVLS